MLPALNGSLEGYLDSLNRIQSSMNLVQRQVSSGVRVGRASDDPASISQVLEASSKIALTTQSLANMNQLQVELESGDSALQQALKLLDEAGVLASQGASTVAGNPKFPTLAVQVRDLQDRLVALTRTSSNGRFIFSGDLDQEPLYSADRTQAEGVQRLQTAASTRAVLDSAGNTVWLSRTAHEIFDSRDADGTPTEENVFRALNDLAAALESGDPSAVASSMPALKAAQEHLNQHLGLYGLAQTRVTASIDAANRSLLSDKEEMSKLRDTDVAAAAVQLSQLTLQQQAALSAMSKIAQRDLFDFLA